MGHWYKLAHQRCYRLWGSASLYPCIECGGAARDWAYDGMDPSSATNYSLSPEFYMPMCRRCHRQFDLNWYINAPRPSIEKKTTVKKDPVTEAEWDAYLKKNKKVAP